MWHKSPARWRKGLRLSTCRGDATCRSPDAAIHAFPVGSAGRRQQLRARAEKGLYMTRTALSRSARRVLRRQHSRERISVAIGISLNWVFLAADALAAGRLPQGGGVAGAGTITAQPNVLAIRNRVPPAVWSTGTALISARETVSLSITDRAPRSIA